MQNTPHSRHRRRTAITSFCLALVVGVGVGSVTASCASSPDPLRYTIIDKPDFKQFMGDGTAQNLGVHAFLESRCGTLDCHGQVGRPFRLFSFRGLRARNDAGLISGSGTGDTTDEVYANYVSAVGLEPEETSRVINQNDPPQTLLLVRKPRGSVENSGMLHKGGTVITQGDAADKCLTTWLSGQADVQACNDAALVP